MKIIFCKHWTKYQFSNWEKCSYQIIAAYNTDFKTEIFLSFNSSNN